MARVQVCISSFIFLLQALIQIAGQSTSMHALDVFLGIDHKKAGHGFMNRMRQYMPGKHRDYLGHIASIPVSLRSLAQQAAGVSESYVSLNCIVFDGDVSNFHARTSASSH